MSFRKIATVADVDYFPGFSAVVHRDSEWNEFRIRLVRHGKLDAYYLDFDAFESDKESALGTAHAMIREAYRNQERARILDAANTDGVNNTLCEAQIVATEICMPLTITWIIDHWAVRNAITSESAQHGGILTVLPANYFA